MSRPRRDLGTLVVEDTMVIVSSVLQTAAREEKVIEKDHSIPLESLLCLEYGNGSLTRSYLSCR